MNDFFNEGIYKYNCKDLKNREKTGTCEIIYRKSVETNSVEIRLKYNNILEKTTFFDNGRFNNFSSNNSIKAGIFSISKNSLTINCKGNSSYCGQFKHFKVIFSKKKYGYTIEWFVKENYKFEFFLMEELILEE